MYLNGIYRLDWLNSYRRFSRFMSVLLDLFYSVSLVFTWCGRVWLCLRAYPRAKSFSKKHTTGFKFIGWWFSKGFHCFFFGTWIAEHWPLAAVDLDAHANGAPVVTVGQEAQFARDDDRIQIALHRRVCVSIALNDLLTKRRTRKKSQGSCSMSSCWCEQLDGIFKWAIQICSLTRKKRVIYHDYDAKKIHVWRYPAGRFDFEKWDIFV